MRAASSTRRATRTVGRGRKEASARHVRSPPALCSAGRRRRLRRRLWLLHSFDRQSVSSDLWHHGGLCTHNKIKL
jgi:hypothetical protein